MHFRRSAAVALAAAALVTGCKKVSLEDSPSEIAVAAFNAPVVPGGAAVVPTPNDLALKAIPTLPAGAQRALLQAFVAAGGFPGDQAVGITIPIKRLAFDPATGKYALQAVPPTVDPASLTTTGAPNVVVLKIDGATPLLQQVEVDLPNCTPGQIALVKARSATGSRAWAPGRYAFAIRGGPGGVRTSTGLAISADQGIALVAPNKDLSNPNNQPPGGLPSALVALLEPVRFALWNPVSWNDVGGYWACGPSPVAGCTVSPTGVGAFPAVAPYIEPEKVAVIGTFEVAAGAPVAALPGVVLPVPTAQVDSGSGLAPLPNDLMRTASHGTRIDPTPFGASLAGLGTLDGFSTTALVFAPVTVPVDVSTVNSCNVHLFKIVGGVATLQAEFKREAGAFAGAGCGPTGAGPTAAAYVVEPDPLTTSLGGFLAPGVQCAAAGGCAPVIGLQPAASVPNTPYAVPPLDEATDYAVVITTGVHDMFGRQLAKSTVGKILVDPGFDAVASSSVDGTSYLVGISNPTASALLRMRLDLQPVLAELQARTGKTAADVALAYTFRTQTVKATSRQIVGLPYAYGTGVSSDPDALTTYGPAAAATAYGLDPALLTTFGNLAEIDEVKLTTRSMRALAQNTGTFEPNGLSTAEKLTALVALPNPARVTGACPDPTSRGGAAYSAVACAPLVVFAHGLGGSKAEMLALAATLTDRGFVVAAIDAELHGERSYCTSSAQCFPGSTCNTYANLQTPVDPVPVGFCESAPGVRGKYLSYRLDCQVPFTGRDAQGNPIPNPACGTTSGKGTAFVSANRFVTMNFFRVRDAIRQDLIDTSALVKALAPIGKSADAFASHVESTYGYAVDFSKVYFIGHSYGAIAGTSSLAVNPRFTAGVQVAGGATAIDVFSSPESRFNADFLALLASSGVYPGSSDYLKLLQIGKWILDPAEPANYAQYVTGAVHPIPSNALTALFPTTSRDLLAQLSLCDGTVPNAQNILLSKLAGFVPPLSPASGSTGKVQWLTATGAASCPGDKVSHSIIADYSMPDLTYRAQGYAADFLADVAPRANVVTPVYPTP